MQSLFGDGASGYGTLQPWIKFDTRTPNLSRLCACLLRKGKDIGGTSPTVSDPAQSLETPMSLSLSTKYSASKCGSCQPRRWRSDHQVTSPCAAIMFKHTPSSQAKGDAGIPGKRF